MRILVLDQFGELGGAQQCLIDAVQGFEARGWEVHAFVPEGPLLERLTPFTVTARHLPCPELCCGSKSGRDALSFLRHVPRQCAAIRTIVRERDIQALYVNGPRLMPAAALAHASARVVFHAHSRVEQRSAVAVLGASIQRSGAHVIACSHFTSAPFAQVAAGRLTIVANGVPRVIPAQSETRRPFTVGMLGRIAPEKGALEFARAAGIVRANSNEFRFVLGGDVLFTADRSYAEKVRDECRTAGVELGGWISDVGRFFADVDLLVVPSSPQDATPRVILEAFSAGIPVVAFAAGGIPEVVRDGIDGVLVPPGNVTALAAQISSLTRRPDVLRQIASDAYERWRADFTVARFQERVCEKIEAVAARRQKRTPLARAGVSAEA